MLDQETGNQLLLQGHSVTSKSALVTDEMSSDNRASEST